MNLSELVRLATQPGPMQKLAQEALMEEFAADERSENMRGRNEQFNIERFAPKYLDEYVNAEMRGPPRGDYGPEEERAAAEERGMRELMRMYDRQYPEPLMGRVGGTAKEIGGYLASPEGVVDTSTMLADTFLPAYSQMDSLKWADENMDKFVNAKEYGLDPLTATTYLPAAAVGYIGSIPGLSSLVSGGRKLGLAGKTAYEGLFARGGKV